MAVIQSGSVNLNSLSRPELYVQIIPPTTLAINGVPTNILGIVGLASWGPVNSPVTVSSMSDFNQSFGPILPIKHDLGSAVYNAYLNGANNMRCVRVTDGSDVKASIPMVDVASAPATGLTLTALYSGAVGNTVVASIAAGTSSTIAAPTYKISISMPNNPLPEVFDNIGGTGLVLWENIVNAVNLGNASRSQSQMVRAAIGSSIAAPKVASYVLVGGTNGNASVGAIASVRLMDGETIPELGATISAKSVGVAGNTISVVLAEGTSSTELAPTIKISVSSAAHPVAEVYDDIGGDANVMWANMVTALSASVIVNAVVGAAVGKPVLGSYSLSGGLDAGSEISSSSFIGVDGSVRTGMYSLRGTQTSIAMICDMDDSTTWATQAAYGLSEGTYMVLTTIKGQYNSIDAMIALKKTAGLDNYDAKLMLGDWCYFSDTTNNVQRLISPQSFVAGRLANLSPENTSLNKQIAGVLSTEALYNSKTYSGADLDKLTIAGIDLITSPAPGGNYFAARIGHNTSSVALQSNDSYTRMTNYLAYTLNSAMGGFIGKTQTIFNTDSTRSAVKATISSFLQELLKNNMIQDYLVVCDTSNNSPASISLNYLYCDISVQYMSIVEKFIVNLNGSTISINRQIIG